MSCFLESLPNLSNVVNLNLHTTTDDGSTDCARCFFTITNHVDVVTAFSERQIQLTADMQGSYLLQNHFNWTSNFVLRQKLNKKSHGLYQKNVLGYSLFVFCNLCPFKRVI